jgi:hypothetical protein
MNAIMNLDAGNHSEDAASEHAIHLSEEQIEDQLLGELSGGAAAHLAGCDHCTARVAAAAEPITDFCDVAMAWSERRSATMPLPVGPTDGLLWQRRMGWVTAAFAVALGLSLVGGGHRAAVETASVEPDQTLEATSAAPAQVAAAPRVVAVEAVQDTSADRYSGDNRMLQAIDTELDASVETPATLGLQSGADQSSNESSQTSLED